MAIWDSVRAAFSLQGKALGSRAVIPGARDSAPEVYGTQTGRTGSRFAAASAKRQLEAILHPRIRETSRAQVEAAGTPYAILVVPLLLETGAYRDVVDRVAAVDCDEARQIERVMARSGLSEQEVKAIMATQIARDERLRQADDVISNDSDIDALRDAVRKLHARYVELSRR